MVTASGRKIVDLERWRMKRFSIKQLLLWTWVTQHEIQPKGDNRKKARKAWVNEFSICASRRTQKDILASGEYMMIEMWANNGCANVWDCVDAIIVETRVNRCHGVSENFRRVLIRFLPQMRWCEFGVDVVWIIIITGNPASRWRLTPGRDPLTIAGTQLILAGYT